MAFIASDLEYELAMPVKDCPNAYSFRQLARFHKLVTDKPLEAELRFFQADRHVLTLVISLSPIVRTSSRPSFASGKIAPCVL